MPNISKIVPPFLLFLEQKYKKFLVLGQTSRRRYANIFLPVPSELSYATRFNQLLALVPLCVIRFLDSFISYFFSLSRALSLFSIVIFPHYIHIRTRDLDNDAHVFKTLIFKLDLGSILPCIYLLIQISPPNCKRLKFYFSPLKLIILTIIIVNFFKE